MYENAPYGKKQTLGINQDEPVRLFQNTQYGSPDQNAVDSVSNALDLVMPLINMHQKTSNAADDISTGVNSYGNDAANNISNSALNANQSMGADNVSQGRASSIMDMIKNYI